MLVDKLSSSLNISALLDTIQSESVISKSEQSHIKNCILSGKILLYRSLLNLKNLDAENMMKLFKIILDLLTNQAYRSAELPLIVLVNDFLERIFNSYYDEFQDSNQKKAVKNFEKMLSLIHKGQTINKTNFNNVKDLSEISIYFILHKLLSRVEPTIKKSGNSGSAQLNQQLKKMLESFVSKNFLNNLLDKSSFMNIFSLILKSKRENDFHVSLTFLIESLKSTNDFQITISFWNLLIDNKSQILFKSISQKNYQFLIFKFARFILESFTVSNFESIAELFDVTFFETVLTFSADKKFKYINQLIEILQDRLVIVKDSENSKKVVTLMSNYCLSLLNLFGISASFSLSPNSNKNFFMVSLFSFINNLVLIQ